MLPGDFGEAVLGQAATKETVAAFRRELGLDEPAYMRYAQWIGNVVQGDLGTSFSGRNASGVDRSRPVVDLIAPRLWNTLFLASMTAIIAVPISLALGISSALYRNSIYDRTINTATLTTISFPEFFVAYILILLLASLWPVFPSLANVDAATIESAKNEEAAAKERTAKADAATVESAANEEAAAEKKTANVDAAKGEAVAYEKATAEERADIAEAKSFCCK